jgi:hypothetical protein
MAATRSAGAGLALSMVPARMLENAAGIKELHLMLTAERGAFSALRRAVAAVWRGVVDTVKQAANLLVGIMRAIPEAVMGIPRQVRLAEGQVTGDLFTLFSGDYKDAQPPVRYDPASTKPAVLIVPGMKTDEWGLINVMKPDVMSSFKISEVGVIENYSHGIIGELDVLQMLGHELFGAYDKTVINTVAALKQGINEKGMVFAIAHSQGSAILHLALSLLTPDERARVHVFTVGPEWAANKTSDGVASAANYWNKNDIVPALANWAMLPVNLVVPGRFGRIFVAPNRTKDGTENAHYFSSYEGALKDWASRMTKIYDEYRQTGVAQ